MNVKISVLVICVKSIIDLSSYNLHDLRNLHSFKKTCSENLLKIPGKTTVTDGISGNAVDLQIYWKKDLTSVFLKI